MLRSFSLSSIISGTLEFSKAFNKSALMGDQTQQQLADTYSNTGVLIPLPLLADLLKAFLNSSVPVIMEPKGNEPNKEEPLDQQLLFFMNLQLYNPNLLHLKPKKNGKSISSSVKKTITKSTKTPAFRKAPKFK